MATEILAACELPGHFQPLRLSGLVTILGPIRSWAEELAGVMAGFNGPVHLSDLYRAFAGYRRTETNENWQAKIRQKLQQGGYRNVGPGLWEAANG